jgi:hypothetical protein
MATIATECGVIHPFLFNYIFSWGCRVGVYEYEYNFYNSCRRAKRGC